PFAVIAIVVTALLYNRWLFDTRLFFHADDWTWLWRAEFVPWSNPDFSILPTHAYNDRPVGRPIIKVPYNGIRLPYAPFHLTLLLLHVVNCVLLYTFGVRYVGRAGALLAALLAAVWFAANTAVMWVAAIFDVVGATLCLAALRFRQRAIASDKPLRYD